MTSIIEHDSRDMISNSVTKIKTADSIAHTSSFAISNKTTPSYLKKIDELIAEMQGKSLNVIIENGLAYEISLQREGRKLTVEFKFISEDKMRHYTDQKVEVYGRTHGLWTATFQCVGGLLAGAATSGLFTLVANQQTFQAIDLTWKGISTGIGAVDNRYVNQDKSDETSHGFHFEMNRDIKSEHTQRIQQSMQASQDIEHKLEAVARFIHDLVQRLFS